MNVCERELLFSMFVFPFLGRVVVRVSWLGTHYVDQTSFELIEIHLPLPPECCD